MPAFSNPVNFPVVGVGASTIGIRSLCRLLESATVKPITFLVLMGGDPEGISLREKLHCSLEIVDSVPVGIEEGKMYLLPYDREISLNEGFIIPGEIRTECSNPIDLFFRSLADAFRNDAYAVILAGTGNDGLLGIERIKERGGFVLLDDQAEAEEVGLATYLLSKGHADVVLSAAEIPQKIAAIFERYRSQPFAAGENSPESVEDRAAVSLREILTLVRVRTGHDFTGYKRPTILRRIDRRLQVHEMEDMNAYAQLLRDQPDEVQRLLKDLLITVTNYFRDSDSFGYLEQNVIPRLFEGKTSKECVRVWSCGCSSGEEPYSLGMLLLEYADQLPEPPRIQIFASDINEDAVKTAREGCYLSSIRTDVSQSRLKRFFVDKGDGTFQVCKELRELVLFAPHNVLHDPPFSHLDLVVCRNLLIYLNRESQKRIMELFNFALVPGGHLFLGSSEGAEGGEELFTTLDKKNRLYRTFHQPKRPIIYPGQQQFRIESIRPHPPTHTLDGTLLENHHHRLVSRYAPASVLINGNHEILHMIGDLSDVMQMPPGLPTRDLIKSAHPSLQLDLRAVLMNAIHERREAKVQGARLKRGHLEKRLNLMAKPAEIPGGDYYLVVFETAPDNANPSLEPLALDEISRESVMGDVVRRLEEELQETRERLHRTVEQGEVTAEELKASNEELQAINEELRSATEELEMSREELQSVNEELATVNVELKDKVEEISKSHSDLQNLMHSSDIGTVFLTRDLTVRRYTRRVEQVINIIESDVGRPFDHLTYKFDYAHLAEDAQRVIDTLQTVERQLVVPSTGNLYLVRISPYRTMEDRIEGLAISFVDITEIKLSSISGT